MPARTLSVLLLIAVVCNPVVAYALREYLRGYLYQCSSSEIARPAAERSANLIGWHFISDYTSDCLAYCPGLPDSGGLRWLEGLQPWWSWLSKDRPHPQVQHSDGQQPGYKWDPYLPRTDAATSRVCCSGISICKAALHSKILLMQSK